MIRRLLLAAALVLGSFPAFAQNYQATQGSGTTFGSKLVSAVNYPQIVFCDPTTPSQCAAVDSSGYISIKIASGQVASGAFASGAFASGSHASGSFAVGAGTDGWNVTDGAKADSACGTATGTCSTIALLKYLNTAASGANPVNVNGTVTAQTGLTPGVSQTGTIVAANVDLSSVVGTAIAVNSGNLSAGVQRNVLATNSPAIPTWGHGATGAAVPSGATYMGIISGGNLTGWTGAVSQSGTWTVQPGNTANTTPWLTTPAAGTANGATPYTLVAAATNNSTNVKASAGTVYAIQTGNVNSTTPYYLKLYDKATAPTCGTDTPVAVYLIPPSNSGNNVNTTVGKAFTLGIGFCLVTGIGNSDNTSVPASTIVLNIDYK